MFIIMNKNKWNSLPPDIQKQIMSVSGKYGAGFHGRAWDKSALEAEEILLKELKKKGGDAITLPPGEITKWRETAAGIWDKEVKRWEAKGKPAGEILKEIEAFVKEYK